LLGFRNGKVDGLRPSGILRLVTVWWCPTFPDSLAISFSRAQWIFGHLTLEDDSSTVSKRQALITQWWGTISQKNGNLKNVECFLGQIRYWRNFRLSSVLKPKIKIWRMVGIESTKVRTYTNREIVSNITLYWVLWHLLYFLIWSVKLKLINMTLIQQLRSRPAEVQVQETWRLQSMSFLYLKQTCSSDRKYNDPAHGGRENVLVRGPLCGCKFWELTIK
jgi:hypothetical protein